MDTIQKSTKVHGALPCPQQLRRERREAWMTFTIRRLHPHHKYHNNESPHQTGPTLNSSNDISTFFLAVSPSADKIVKAHTTKGSFRLLQRLEVTWTPRRH